MKERRNNYPVLCVSSECTGCGACMAVCPKSCIEMVADEEGFSHPHIDKLSCVGCNRCMEICPILNKKYGYQVPQEKIYPEVYAGWHLDSEIRRKSSSGGIFTALAVAVLNRGGVVSGAAYNNNLEVYHIIINSVDELYRLRGSKYVQSTISISVFEQIRQILDSKKFVLFSGTPCQIAGLRSFIGISTDYLICCDLICRGVPSPVLFSRYVDYCRRGNDVMVDFSFRDKSTGWCNFSIVHYFSSGRFKRYGIHDDPYMESFLRNYTLRRCCYFCRFAKPTRPGDLTIGDFWRVLNYYPKYDPDNKGTSLILVNNEQGKLLIEQCKEYIFLGKAGLSEASSCNPSFVHPIGEIPPERDFFYRDLAKVTFKSLINKYRLKSPIWLRFMRYVRYILIKVFPLSRRIFYKS